MQAEHAPRDGQISFFGYSDGQLLELKDTIDRDRFPLNFANLISEIALRDNRGHLPASSAASVEGRFTRLDGIRGWIEAKRTSSPLYGHGSVEITSTDVVLNGWHSTWLGIPAQVQSAYPISRVRNVDLDAGAISFEIKAPYRVGKRITFYSDAADALQDLAEQLPTTVTRSFQKNSGEIRDFTRRMRLVAKRPVITPVIVALNVLVFAYFCIVSHRLGGFSPQALIDAGSNYGPLTVIGQWWRLISAVFIHFNLLHLAMNMWAFWYIGRLSEQLFGRYAFAFLYLSCGILASLASIAWNPALSSIGASGAIFGIFGAFIAFYVRPENRVPVAIARRHWVSTGAFVCFNLISGALEPGIDNAAHVGGLLAGFGLGWLLARPLEFEHRAPRDGRRHLFAGITLVAAVSAGVWQVKGSGSQLTIPELYARRHSSFIDRETENLRQWNDLAVKAARGEISDSELGERFERDIVPFWTSAHAQIDLETKSLRGPEKTYALLVSDFVRLRYEWALKAVEAVKTHDPETFAAAVAYVQKVNKAQARLDRVKLRAQMDHRPRALSNGAVATKIRRLFTVLEWKCVGASTYPHAVPKATDNPLDGPSARYAAGCRAQQLFMGEDYAALDVLMTQYVKAIPDLPDGTSRYEGVVAGLNTLFQYGGIDPMKLLGRTSDWRRAVQDPAKPDLLEALIFEDWAWSVRGNGSADSVSAQKWVQFAYRVEMAAASLEDTAGSAATDPTWYQYSIRVGLDQDMEIALLREIFEKGSTQFPGYRPIEWQMLQALMPRWHGSYDQVDQFINDVYANTAKERGYERYAELYSEYAAMEGDDVQLFSDTPAFWSGMSQGFIGLLKRYPRSDVVLNLFATMACRAGDADQYRNLRDKLTSRYSSVAWSSKISLKSCDAKFSGAPAAARPETAAQFNPRMPILSLGGVRLGMTARELLEAKGEPIHKTTDYWTYNSIDASHNGVLTAGFGKSDGSDPQVAGIEFIGDAESSPKELPYLDGLSESDLRDRFSYLVGMASPSDDITRLKYKNGVYADLQNDRVVRYGIYAVSHRR